MKRYQTHRLIERLKKVNPGKLVRFFQVCHLERGAQVPIKLFHLIIHAQKPQARADLALIISAPRIQIEQHFIMLPALRTVEQPGAGVVAVKALKRLPIGIEQRLWRSPGPLLPLLGKNLVIDGPPCKPGGNRKGMFHPRIAIRIAPGIMLCVERKPRSLLPLLIGKFSIPKPYAFQDLRIVNEIICHQRLCQLCNPLGELIALPVFIPKIHIKMPHIAPPRQKNPKAFYLNRKHNTR